uniref:L1 transposable element RRM domain-containing protein n=1 Tax=Latimeria chalumnae TaxID=7897 RepID=H3AFW5_LATCH
FSTANFLVDPHRPFRRSLGEHGEKLGIRGHVTSIKGDLGRLAGRLLDAENKLTYLELCGKDREERLDNLEREVEQQGRYVSELWDHMQDLENQSRHNNIRILGVPGLDSLERSTAVLLHSILTECLGLDDPAMETERAHRTLGPKPASEQRPRLIIARLLRFTDREKILRHAREMGKIQWRDTHLMFFPDMSKELAAHHKKFTAARHRCMALGLKYALQYPAILRI